jgi:hypothetical protein
MNPRAKRDLTPFGQLDHVPGGAYRAVLHDLHFSAGSSFQINVSRRPVIPALSNSRMAKIPKLSQIDHTVLRQVARLVVRQSVTKQSPNFTALHRNPSPSVQGVFELE